MKQITLLTLAVVTASFATAQEAGYAIHVDFKTKQVTRAIVVPKGVLADVPLLGDLNVSALLATEGQFALGVGLGKSGSLGGNASWQVGFSYLDPSGEYQPHFGGYLGFTWKL